MVLLLIGACADLNQATNDTAPLFIALNNGRGPCSWRATCPVPVQTAACDHFPGLRRNDQRPAHLAHGPRDLPWAGFVAAGPCTAKADDQLFISRR